MHGPDVLVRQRRAHAAGQERRRHDRAGERRGDQRGARRRAAIGGPRIATGEFLDRLRHDQRLRRASITRSPARSRLAAALQPLRRRQRQRAQRRRAERRQPRHAARRHRPDGRRSAGSRRSRRRVLQRAAGAVDAQPARRAGQRPDRAGGHDLRRRQPRHVHDLADRARPRRRAGGRYAHAPARRAPAQGRRRPALQPRDDRVSRRAAGQLHVHVARQPPARASTSSFSRRSASRRCRSRTRTSACSCRTSGVRAEPDGERAACATTCSGCRIRLRSTRTTSRRASASPGRRAIARTVVRASGGVYFDRIPLRATSNALQRDGMQLQGRGAVVRAGGRAGVSARAAGVSGRRADARSPRIDPEIQNGRSEQFGVQVERALGRATSVTAGYSCAARRRASSCRATSTCRR